jgi:thiol-disulfide isomerase/thioredoxin
MKANLVIFVVILLAGFVLGQAFVPSQPPLNGAILQASPQYKKSPDFSFTDLSGKTHTLSDHTGKTIILNFWASWCPPCVSEFPDLLDFAARNPGVILIALSSDKDTESIKRFFSRLDTKPKSALRKPNIIIGIDVGQKITHDLFQTVSLPETIIIGPEGDMLHKIVGPIDFTIPLEGQLEELLR